ncbi:MAG: lipoate--protein ligase [Mycoplasmoidaceae bacterium]
MKIIQSNEKIWLFISDKTNPFYNLALEEFLLTKIFENYHVPIIFLWRNQNTIVIGQNQIAEIEIDLETAAKDGVNLVKRLSGGGTVFHDLGNFCFSFIVKNENQAGNYQIFLEPIIDFFKNYGLDAKIHGKNDLTINDIKISGNAQYLYKNSLLHHGTLLYDVNLQSIKKYLKLNPIKLNTKVQRSQVTQVANIIDFLENKIDKENMFKNLVDFFKKQKNIIKFNLSEKTEGIQILKSKFENYDWTFFHPAGLKKHNSARFDGGTISLWLKLNDNIIEKIIFEGDFLSIKKHDELQEKFVNQELKLTSIEKLLDEIIISDYFGKISKKELLALFFNIIK